MNRYMLIRRLRGPAFLLLIGVMALLSQADILGWGQSWPLLLILMGVLLLAERAALATMGGDYPLPGAVPPPYPGAPYGSAPYPGAPYAAPVNSTATPAAPVSSDPGSAIVPASTQSLTRGSEGGQS